MEQTPPAEPQQTCAYTGALMPESSMVQIGGHWIAAEHKDACVQFLQQGGVLPAQPRARTAPPPRLVPIWKESWQLFVPAFPALLLMHLLVWLPCYLLSSYMDYEVYDEDDVRSSLFFYGKLQLWFGIIAGAGCLFALGEVWHGRRPAFAQVIGAGFRFWPRMWLITFLAGLAIIVGFIALIIPGIILMARYAFAECYAVNANRTAVESLGASNRLARGNFWRIAFVMTVTTVAMVVPFFVMSIGSAFIPEEWDTWQLNGVLTWLGEIPELFVWAVLYVLWQSLRREEGEQAAESSF